MSFSASQRHRMNFAHTAPTARDGSVHGGEVRMRAEHWEVKFATIEQYNSLGLSHHTICIPPAHANTGTDFIPWASLVIYGQL